MARSEYQRAYYLANRPRLLRAMKAWQTKNPTYHRDRSLQRTYGIDLKTWTKLFKSQNNRCAICSTKQPKGRGWSTDHDHKTRRVRGILCHYCNILLGVAKDRVKTLNSAIQYLNQSKEKN